MIEIVKEPATGEMEMEVFQAVKSGTGKDFFLTEATVERVVDEMEGDTTRAINRLLDLEAEVKVEKVVFFKK